MFCDYNLAVIGCFRPFAYTTLGKLQTFFCIQFDVL